MLRATGHARMVSKHGRAVLSIATAVAWGPRLYTLTGLRGSSLLFSPISCFNNKAWGPQATDAQRFEVERNFIECENEPQHKTKNYLTGLSADNKIGNFARPPILLINSCFFFFLLKFLELT